MRWRGRRPSRNIADRGGLGAAGGRRVAGGGLLLRLPLAFRFLGVKGTLVLVVCIGAYGLFTGSLGGLLTGLGLQSEPAVRESSAPFRESAEEKERVEFVAVIPADTEETWASIFQTHGKTYRPPRLALFRNAVDSACGITGSAMGPFYCPRDQKVYIDLGFYDQLKNRRNAPPSASDGHWFFKSSAG